MKRHWYQLFNKEQRIISAKVCFFIFFVKMMISATPMFVDVLDKDTIFQVVLQLEIENTAKGNNSALEDLHEHSIKVFQADHIDDFLFAHLIESGNRQRAYLKNEKGRCVFKPNVPTPPPNC